MMLTNKQWLWGNWSKICFGVCFALNLPLLIALAVGMTGPLVTVLAVLSGAGILVQIYALVAHKSITENLEKETLDSPLLKMVYSGDYKGIEQLNLSKQEVQLPFPKEICLLSIASSLGHLEIVKFLLKNDIGHINTSILVFHPVKLAAQQGHSEVVKTLLEHFSKIDNDIHNKIQITSFMLDCFLGNTEKALAQTKEFCCQEKDGSGLTAFHYALIGASNEQIILHLLKLKSNINALGEVHDLEKVAKRSVGSITISPVHVALDLKKCSSELIVEIVKKEKSYAVDNKVTVLMKAAKYGHLDVINQIKDHVNFLEKDSKNQDALDYAKIYKQTNAEKIIRECLDVAVKKQKEIEARKRSQDISLGINTGGHSNQKIEIFVEDIKLLLQTNLRGMVNVETFADNFSHEIKAFMDQRSGSRGIVLWGNSSVGKTEIGKRICNTNKENIAKFELPGVEFRYIACCDASVDVKKIIDNINHKTVVFLDEIDKYLSPSSGLVSESQAKGLRTSLITNFESKDVFWIFSGTFADIRGNKNLTRDLLENTLGKELASRLDFSDWKLSDWTIESLLKASRAALSKDQHLEYDDEALLSLVNYTLEHNAGVRGLEKAHEAIKRNNRSKIKPSEKFTITINEVNEFIYKENAA